MKFHRFHVWLCLVAVAGLTMGCNQQKFSLVFDENSPAQTMKDATIQHTDSGRLQMIMWGEEIWNYDDEEQTQEFPKSVKATFYSETGRVSSIITADEATNWQRKKLMNLRGNVVIQDLRDGKTTYTEDFWWDQDKGEIYSNVAVRQVGRDGMIQRGTGFRSDEQMNNFVIFNPRFTMNL